MKILFYCKYKIWLQVSKINPVWHLDATGLIHRKINRQPQPFFYSIVCHDTEKKNIIPVAEFLTTSNNKPSICRYLEELKVKFLIDSKQKNLPKIIVTDMSWALINSVLYVFNKCSMQEYLIRCWDHLFHKKSFENIVYYTCSTHFLKNIIKKSKGY